MNKRNIAGLPRLHTQRYPDQFGAHLVERRGLGIHRHIAACINPLQPDLQGAGIRHFLIGLRIKRHRLGDHRNRRFDLGRFRPQTIRNPLHNRAKFHLGQKRQQVLGHRIPDLQTVQIKRQHHLAIQTDQALGKLDLRAVLDQAFAALGLLDLAGAVQQCLQITIFIDQKRRRLDPDPRRSWHVIHTIARQCLHIDNTLGLHPELFNHTVAIYALVLHRVQHFNTVANQLHQVLVG